MKPKYGENYYILLQKTYREISRISFLCYNNSNTQSNHMLQRYDTHLSLFFIGRKNTHFWLFNYLGSKCILGV